MGHPRTAADLLAADLARSTRAAQARASEQRSTLRDPTAELLFSLGGAPTSSGARVSPDTAFNVITYYACVDLIAKLVAMLPLRLYQRGARGPAEVTTHNAAWLLRDRPNNFQTPFEFKRYLMACAASRGNGFARVFRDGYYEPTEIVPVAHGQLDPEYIPALRTVIYRGGAVPAGQDHLLGSDVIHVKALSTDGLRGLSPLKVMRETLGLALTYQVHTGSTFANGARVPGVLESATVLGEQDVLKIRASWDQAYGGAENTSKPRILNGLKWASVGMNNEDAELLASRKFEVEEIARFFGIPLHLIQSTEKSTTYGTGIEQLNRSTVDYMLTPWIVNFEQALNSVLLTEQERRAGQMYFKVNLSAFLRGDNTTRATFYKTMRELRALTVNEIREWEELETIDKDIGDNVREPFNGQGGGHADPATTPTASDQTVTA